MLLTKIWEEACQFFNIELANSMADIITGLKDANAELKHKGQVEENEADEMPSALFEFMCECAMHDGNALWWAMSVLQWSLMARVQNIDDLVFRSFTMGSDTIRAKFNQTKTLIRLKLCLILKLRNSFKALKLQI